MLFSSILYFYISHLIHGKDGNKNAKTRECLNTNQESENEKINQNYTQETYQKTGQNLNQNDFTEKESILSKSITKPAIYYFLLALVLHFYTNYLLSLLQVNIIGDRFYDLKTDWLFTTLALVPLIYLVFAPIIATQKYFKEKIKNEKIDIFYIILLVFNLVNLAVLILIPDRSYYFYDAYNNYQIGYNLEIIGIYIVFLLGSMYTTFLGYKYKSIVWFSMGIFFSIIYLVKYILKFSEETLVYIFIGFLIMIAGLLIGKAYGHFKTKKSDNKIEFEE